MLSSVGQAGMGFSGNVTARLGALGLAAVSPAFVTFLLLKVSLLNRVVIYTKLIVVSQVSGVPMSETKYDKRYGDRKDYQDWKKNTPMFIPKF